MTYSLVDCARADNKCRRFGRAYLLGGFDVKRELLLLEILYSGKTHQQGASNDGNTTLHVTRKQNQCRSLDRTLNVTFMMGERVCSY